MKTHDEIKAAALKLITEKVREDCKPVDSDARYCDLLDELNATLAAVNAYSF